MFDPDTLPVIRDAVRRQTELDRALLDSLRADARGLARGVHVVRPRSTTAVSLVASDGGNNKLVFDPFYTQLIRVVDSYGKELFVDVISPTTDTDELSSRQFRPDGSGATALGRLMIDLGVRSLSDLSPMIPDGARSRERPDQVSPSWVLVYRDLCEWAVLYERICYTWFGSDTLLVRDGLLRSKIFRGELFIDLGRRVQAAIERLQREERRRVYLVGLAKRSQVLDRYRLAMALEDTLPAGDPRYVRIPREIEAKAYQWPEYARGLGDEGEGRERPKFVLGDMHFVRFGSRSGDPIWIVDVFTPQTELVPQVFGYLLADAVNGFPVPYYPLCLQKADEYAQVAGFDLDILQDEVIAAIRSMLHPPERDALDAVRMIPDYAARRYD